MGGSISRHLDVRSFTGGIALAYAIRVAFDVDFVQSLIIVGIILIGWEVYEIITKVAEPFTNRMVDLVAGFAGIFIAYQIPLFASLVQSVLTALVFLIVWSGLNIVGWISWKARYEQAEIQFLAQRVVDRKE